MKDYYKILGLARTAHLSEIRKAFRQKALELHPDKNTNANSTQDFVQLNEAYSVLKHISSKVRYDKLYDHYCLNKAIKNTSRFNHKEKSRNQFVKMREDVGREKAQNYAKQTRQQFKKDTDKNSFWDPFSRLLEFIGEILFSLS